MKIKDLNHTVRPICIPYKWCEVGLAAKDNISALDVPPQLILAVLLSEDPYFFQHRGISLIAIKKRIGAWLSGKSGVGAGSTISQQLVKITFSKLKDRILRKPYELFLTSQLESNFSKLQILSLYLSTVRFSNDGFGIASAAEAYFKKPIADLTLAESCLLAYAIRKPTVVYRQFLRKSPNLNFVQFLRSQIINCYLVAMELSSQTEHIIDPSKISLEKYTTWLSCFSVLPLFNSKSIEIRERLNWLAFDKVNEFASKYQLVLPVRLDKL